MNTLCLTGCLLSATVAGAAAQWTTEIHPLRPGWNGVYLLNDPSHASIEAVLAATPAVTKVWRWVPQNLKSTFLSNPLVPVTAAEWKTWVRGEPQNTTMTQLLPGYGYLIYVSGSYSMNLSLTGKAMLVKPAWHSSGANLLGFPAAAATPPRFGSSTGGYFSPMADLGYNPSSTQVYQYNGGEINLTTTPSRLSGLINTQLVRGRAYWMDIAALSDFAAPVEVNVSEGRAMHFGVQGGPQKIRVRNRSAAPLTVTLTPTASVTPPAGQQAIAGMVPLLQRLWNTTAQSFEYAPLPAVLTAALEAGASTEWTLVPNRADMSADPGLLYATALKITDSGAHGTYSLQYVPVTANTGGLGGLWVGEAAIDQVQNHLQRYQRNPDGTNVVDEAGRFVPDGPAVDDPAATAQPFHLRVIVHVDAGGAARLLSNVYMGQLTTLPPAPGFTSRQANLLPAQIGRAVRITATHLPLDVVQILTGSLGAGGTLTATLEQPGNDAVNPFLHTYHPDHDNLDARFAAPAAEALPVSRDISLTLDASGPAGDPQWGAATLTGTYSEVMRGLHKNPISIAGRFSLRRLSTITTFIP
jgi:hypothetical protein